MHTTNDMPLGLKMAITQNLDALNRFAALPDPAQRAFIQGAKQVTSKQGMQAYVDNLFHG